MSSPIEQNIIWIASYPKSGNTWARFLACNLLFGRQVSAAALNALVPDLHEMQATTDPAPRGLLKTHFAYSQDLPYAGHTAAAIYVVRNPADVLASNFFYSLRSAAQADASPAAFDDYVNTFIAHRGDPRWRDHGMGSWEHHVRSWLHGPLPFPVLRIRYEDMAADPLGACRAIAQVLRPGSSEADLEQAVQNSTFERMRAIEREDIREKRIGIFYKPYLQSSIDAGRRFMRRGVVGDGAGRLSAAQLASLSGAFQPLLRELGYA